MDGAANEVSIFDAVSVPGFTPIRARYGFGARTGASTNTHRVDNVRFKIDFGDKDCDFNGTPDDCQADGNGDGTPDACDDDDGDGVPNHEDQCPGFDDNMDTDGDGDADGCDPCPDDEFDDSDGDVVCDSDDMCAGFDDKLDADGDTVPDDCDVCDGPDDTLDADADTIPDGCDPCPNSPSVWNETQNSYHLTIADAIDAATSGDVIELGECVFIERGLQLNKRNITLRGQGVNATIIDGDAVSGRLLDIRNGDSSTISDITFRNGVATGTNGDAALAVRSDSTPLFLRCRFEDNDAGSSNYGAVYLTDDSATTFRECMFEGNNSDQFGSAVGLKEAGTSALFINTSFRGNGGISLNLVECVEGIMAFVNCTFAESLNQRVFSESAGGSIAIRNCVHDASSVPESTITASRCLFPGATGSNINGLPTFVDAANGDFRLAAGSLGIDAADFNAYIAAGGGANDLNGAQRIRNDTGITDTGLGALTYLDMGAFEFQGTTQCGSGGDIGNNGTVDLDDYRRFGSCVNGPIGGLGPDCACFDLDSDGDVDVRDFAKFQLSFTGN